MGINKKAKKIISDDDIAIMMETMHVSKWTHICLDKTIEQDVSLQDKHDASIHDTFKINGSYIPPRCRPFYSGAGVVHVETFNNELCVVLGFDQHKTFNDFGGVCSNRNSEFKKRFHKTTENLPMVAAREYKEETRDIYTVSQNVLRNVHFVDGIQEIRCKDTNSVIHRNAYRAYIVKISGNINIDLLKKKRDHDIIYKNGGVDVGESKTETTDWTRFRIKDLAKHFRDNKSIPEEIADIDGTMCILNTRIRAVFKNLFEKKIGDFIY